MATGPLFQPSVLVKTWCASFLASSLSTSYRVNILKARWCPACASLSISYRVHILKARWCPAQDIHNHWDSRILKGHRNGPASFLVCIRLNCRIDEISLTIWQSYLLVPSSEMSRSWWSLLTLKRRPRGYRLKYSIKKRTANSSFSVTQ